MYNISLPLNNKRVYVQFDRNSIHIANSFSITKSSEMKRILGLIGIAAFNRNISYSRSQGSFIREWKAHNILYKFNIKRKSTKSVDLNENENIFRRIGYFILSLFYWK